MGRKKKHAEPGLSGWAIKARARIIAGSRGHPGAPYVIKSATGYYSLPTGDPISHGGIKMLIAAGLLIPSNDGLFEERNSQTYRLKV